MTDGVHRSKATALDSRFAHAWIGMGNAASAKVLLTTARAVLSAALCLVCADACGTFVQVRADVVVCSCHRMFVPQVGETVFFVFMVCVVVWCGMYGVCGVLPRL